MNSVCANCQNKGTFIHECSIRYCSIIYPTGLRDEQKTTLHQGVSCSINCVLPAGKSVIKQSSLAGINSGRLKAGGRLMEAKTVEKSSSGL